MMEILIKVLGKMDRGYRVRTVAGITPMGMQYE